MNSASFRIASALFALGTTAAVALAAPPVDLPVAGVEVVENITYAQVGDQSLQLDLARPAGDGPFPAIVFIHGGGWKAGNRAAYRKAVEEAAQRGYVAVTISYRLTDPDKNGKPAHPFPAQIHDAKAAVRWLRAYAEKYDVDPRRIGVTGGSAGGHLSLLVGLTDKQSGLEGQGPHTDQSSRVQAVVNVFGPTDLPYLFETTPATHQYLTPLLGGTPASAAGGYQAASPVTYVSKDDPPVLTLHGAADRLVPPEQAERLDAAMKKAGASHTLVVLEGQGHGFAGDAARKANDAMYDFFDRHLKPGRAK